MAILKSIEYSNFERFSNVADEISTKLLSSFLECAVPDRSDFEFAIKAAEKNTNKQTKSFQNYPGNLDSKTNLVKYLLQKSRETLSNVLTSCQNFYLANLDGATDRVTSQSSERIDFY